MIPEEIEFLYRVLSAIRLNLKDFVLVGGFASYLYQFHERAKSTDLSALLTYDIDLASREKISVRGGKIGASILIGDGFRRRVHRELYSASS